MNGSKHIVCMTMPVRVCVRACMCVNACVWCTSSRDVREYIFFCIFFFFYHLKGSTKRFFSYFFRSRASFSRFPGLFSSIYKLQSSSTSFISLSLFFFIVDVEMSPSYNCISICFMYKTAPRTFFYDN